MLEDLGNCVKIHDTVIPAVNIQVDPQEIFRYDHEIQMWIGLYFEIMFEDGSLWVVTQEWPTDPVIFDWFPNWHRVDERGFNFMDQAVMGNRCKDWEAFERMYQVRVNAIDLSRKLSWNKFYKELAS